MQRRGVASKKEKDEPLVKGRQEKEDRGDDGEYEDADDEEDYDDEDDEDEEDEGPKGRVTKQKALDDLVEVSKETISLSCFSCIRLFA